MSIIERYSPLNLAYKVLIVTNASSPTGLIVCNTLLKANALVLGTDDKPKDETLTQAAYTHFQFHECKLSDESSVDAIIEYAKERFKVSRIDGLVNLASADDDAKTQEGHKKLAAACAKNMTANDGGAIVETIIQAPSADAGAKDVTSSKGSSPKVRSNSIAPTDRNDLKSCQQYEDAKQHFEFLFKPPGNPHGKASGKTITKEIQKVFDFSNVVLFLTSGMSEGLDGAVLGPQGQLIQQK